MGPVSKLVLCCCIALVALTLIVHAGRAIDPALPSGMPADAHFVSSGFDLEHNERRGFWVACEPEPTGDSRCRIADAQGTVIYQGVFLPVRGTSGSTSSKTSLLWVTGPAEGGPVPVIPLPDGSVLVPAVNRDALLDRWNQHPDEWRHLADGE